MIKLIRIIKSVRRMLFINPVRITLSLTAIGIGIAAVIVLVSLGQGAQDKMLSQIEAMGSNVITVDAGQVTEVKGRKRQFNKVTTLKEKDVEVITDECEFITAVAPTQEQTMAVKYENSTTFARIIGTYPDFPSIRNFSVASGRFFTMEENELSLRYVVIGNKCVEYLFSNTNPLGKIIKINNLPFEVIGVLNPKGSSYDGANEDDMIFIPLKTGMRRVFNLDYLKNIYVKAINKERIPFVEDKLKDVLRERHKLNIRSKDNDFTIKNVYAAVKVENETDKSFSILITVIAALSLLVGGIGILATMLLSVKERKHEIGLRMAVGARAKDVLFQFLIETIMLCLTGGISGIMIGTLGAYLLGNYTEFAVTISLQASIISFIISLVIGIIFGVYPARKASLIEPVLAFKS